MEEKQRQETKKFRESVEKRINEFLQKETERKLAFEPMDKFHRSLVHDVAEIAGLISYSFGEEDVDRALTVWKKEYQPCEDELECLRRGEEYDPLKSYQEKREREKLKQMEEQEERLRKKQKTIPKSNYQHKYEHLLKDSTLTVAVKETNKAYGLVSAESKKDRRTVEDIQADIR